MAINNGRVYTFKDLDPLLNEIKQNAKTLNDMNVNYTLNVEPQPSPKMPKEQRETVAQRADDGNWAAINKIKTTEKNVNKVIDNNQKVLQQYRDEMDRRNAILNRMQYLKQIMKYWLDSDEKNRLAGMNTLKKSVREYRQLKGEADKFIGYIKEPTLDK